MLVRGDRGILSGTAVDVLPRSAAGEAIGERRPAGIQALSEALSRALSAADIASAVCHHLPAITNTSAATLLLRVEPGDALNASASSE
jgi:hypothetical protein